MRWRPSISYVTGSRTAVQPRLPRSSCCEQSSQNGQILRHGGRRFGVQPSGCTDRGRLKPELQTGRAQRMPWAVRGSLARSSCCEQAEGFKFTEGPVWVRDGFLLFSDPNSNRIYKYTSDGSLSVFRENSGYAGADIAEYAQPGSNGLTLDREGPLTINEHGNRGVTRLEKNGELTVLADRD